MASRRGRTYCYFQQQSMKILGINISHHGSSCLLENNKIKFFLEDERVSRVKGYCVSENDSAWDAGYLPIYFLEAVLKYTNHVDYIIFSSFEREEENPRQSDDVIIDEYLERLKEGGVTWGDVVYQSENHHIYHAATGFYGSGLDNAVALVMDGGGGLYKDEDVIEDITGGYDYFRELESIYSCDYTNGIVKEWQHYGFNGSSPESVTIIGSEDHFIYEEGNDVISNTLSCGPLFNRMSYLLGFTDGGDAGKVMGMASYCKNSSTNSGWWDEIDWYTDDDIRTTTTELGDYLGQDNPFPFKRKSVDKEDFFLKCRVARRLQDETLEHTLTLIERAVEITGSSNVILSGGYSANCMNNYRYLQELHPGIKLYVDPIPNDAGTALGAARWLYYKLTKSHVKNPLTTLYLS